MSLEWLTEEEQSLPRDESGRFEKYGIKFVSIAPADLEFLRSWRNHPDIQRFMVFRNEITPEMQEHWYQAIDPEKDCYSILVYRDERIGITQLRNIDPVERCGEGGIIIFRPEHQNGLIPYRVSIAGMDWNFLHRRLAYQVSTVLKSNTRAQRFVKSLGYQLHDPDPAGEVLRGRVTSEDYFRAAAKWRRIVQAAAAESSP